MLHCLAYLVLCFKTGAEDLANQIEGVTSTFATKEGVTCALSPWEYVIPPISLVGCEWILPSRVTSPLFKFAFSLLD